MASRSGFVSPQEKAPPAPKKRTRAPLIPWKPFVYTGIPAAIAWYYLAIAAPKQIPVPAGLEVPFPEVIPHLEILCAWCGEHFGIAGGIAGGLVLLTLLAPNPQRCAFWLGVVILSFTGFAYFSISAPVERLLRAVEDKLPEERQLPDYMEKKG